MQKSFTSKTVMTLASLAGLSLMLSACSDTTTAPSSLRSGSSAFTIGPTANAPGSTVISFASSSSTEFCSSATALYTYTIPGTYAPVAGCGTAFDLSTPLLAYNPGWSAPLSGSTWIGPAATSNEYRTNPGTYVFQTTFPLPAGATNIVLNDTILSDNAVAVFLNGHPVEQQVISDCTSGTCNWVGAFIISDAIQSDFVAGTNTITVLLVDTPNGGTPGNNYACTKLPQPFGSHGFTNDQAVPTSPNHIVANWTQTMTTTSGCENPAGLDFHGTVSYLPAVTLQWCSPGFWKNHTDLWTAFLGVKYNTLTNKAPLKAGSPSNPTLLQVVSNPSVYGGPATNSVADYLSLQIFGSNVGTSADDANCNGGVPLSR